MLKEPVKILSNTYNKVLSQREKKTALPGRLSWRSGAPKTALKGSREQTGGPDYSNLSHHLLRFSELGGVNE